MFAMSGFVAYALLPLIAAGLGYAVSVFIESYSSKVRREQARTVIDAAKRKAKAQLRTVREEAEGEAARQREAAMVDVEDERATVTEFDRRLSEREEDLDERDSDLRAKKGDVDRARREIRTQEFRIREARRTKSRLRDEQTDKLLEIVEVDRDAMRARFLEALDADVARETERVFGADLERFGDEVDGIARAIIECATQRMEISHARDERTYQIEVPKAEVLAERGFAPESELWEAFKEEAGVELAFDEEALTLTVSCLDGVRRETARRAMCTLLGVTSGDARRESRRGGKGARGKSRRRTKKKREPAIESWTRETMRGVLDETGKELIAVLEQQGRSAAQSLRLKGNRKLHEYLGRLNYRTSYGQNILKHSQEVGHLGGMIGAEGDFDARLAKRCCFLHDVGKGIDYELEGGHPEIGANIADECGENETVINAVAAHHDDVPHTTLYPLLVQAADAISGARPGARRRTTEKYMMRMVQIEQIAHGQPGVEGAFVVQAGREVRVHLVSDRTTDDDARSVADAIARELEAEMNFPGRIKVTVVREKRVSAVAR